MNTEVETYLDNLKQWKKELTLLRDIVCDCGLIEDFKWMHPCYTYNGKNVVLIHEFKTYCAILFPKGVLLKDSKQILVQQTENTQSARQIRFTNLSEIEGLKSTIKAYVFEAVEVEKAGLKVRKKKTSHYDKPEELEKAFQEHPEFDKAFKNLSPGRQNGYFLHFSKPKQSKTRAAQIEKCMQRILDGYGLRDCTCGLSKRKPNCDGSHKQLIN